MSERGGDIGSGMLPESHPHAGRNPTENECGGIHRISQREKQFDDFSTTRESEVQIWESIILVQRVLRGHRRKEYEKDRGIHSKSVERRSTYRSDDVKGIHGPACGYQVTILCKCQTVMRLEALPVS